MANAAKLSLSRPARILIVGYPGSAKTGSLASLANAGFKLRVLDYDGNLEPLLLYTKPDKLANIDIVSFEDKLRAGSRFIEPVGIPEAFANGLKMLDHWTYTDDTGETVDLGSSKDWGCDTVVVLDSLTAMGLAAFRRAAKMLNKTPETITDRVWGLAMAEQEAFVEKLTSAANRFHVVVLGHLKMVGPNDVRKGDSDLTTKLKTDLAELVRTRMFPSALGKALPPVISGHFPTVVQAEPEYKGTKVLHALRTQPRPDLDLKVPSPNVPATLYVEDDGLLKVFQALNPRVLDCLEKGGDPNPQR